VSWLPKLFERRKDELDEEIRAHIAMDIANRMERGELKEQAEAEARREFGNVALVRDVTHAVWRWRRLERFTANLRYALRVLRRSPGFSITVIATLAVGVGATCAMFTVVDRVLLRPVPFADADRLVEIGETSKGGSAFHGSPFLDIHEWQERSRMLREIAFFDANNGRVWFLGGNGDAMHVSSASVSANLFPMLGVHPALGRGFVERDSGGSVAPGDAHAIVLSDAVWRTQYGADPAIAGKTVELNGERDTVIGVMPRGFTFPYEGMNSTGLPAVWQPIVLTPADALRGHHQAPPYQCLARMQTGVTADSAETELNAIQPSVAATYTNPEDRDNAASVNLRRYTDTPLKGNIRMALLALLAASGLLWLIACLNVTSLMLARATARQREIAVRGALGASRWEIVEQLLMEGVLLSGCASLAGLGLVAAVLKVFQHGLETQFNLHESLTPNLAVMGALLLLTVVSTLLTSALPAWGAARASIEPALRQGAPQQGMGRVQHRMRAVLVVSQISLSLTLLVGCGLLLRTIYALRHVSLGFRTEHILVTNMTIPSYKYAGRDMTTALYQPLVDRVKHLPGVESATLLTEVPLGKTFSMIFSFDTSGNSSSAIRKRAPWAQFRAVGPEMQNVFGFHMLRGRFFNQGDTATSQAVVVVNRAFIREYYGDDSDPGKILGQSLFGFEKGRPAVVVGVLADERQVNVSEPSQPEIEVCLPQITRVSMFYNFAEGRAMDLAVRTDRSPATMIPELRDILRAASPDLASSTFSTMDQIVEDSFGSQNLAAELLEIFGGSALLLCLTGIYGLLVYLVAQRRREMGLRIALGAQQWNVMSLVLRQAAWMLVAGLSIGLAIAYLATAALQTLLYGVKANDPWSMGGAALVILLGGLAAALVPARRAARVDPMEALRAE
jgi:predicted permease